jgi:hypothetical protein
LTGLIDRLATAGLFAQPRAMVRRGIRKSLAREQMLRYRDEP